MSTTLSLEVTRHWHLQDATATRAAGKTLGLALLELKKADPLIVTLQGELGAGKTTLVGGLLATLGHVGPVRSPTYTLIEPYDLAGRQWYHLDLYRLTNAMQLEELGVRDLLHSGAILLVEWPERASELLAKSDLGVRLAYPGTGREGRQLQLLPGTESLRQLVDRLVFSVENK
jgi:tRNA threonylcarbamoyladenosine biosynthesis protein TsaE